MLLLFHGVFSFWFGVQGWRRGHPPAVLNSASRLLLLLAWLDGKAATSRRTPKPDDVLGQRALLVLLVF